MLCLFLVQCKSLGSVKSAKLKLYDFKRGKEWLVCSLELSTPVFTEGWSEAVMDGRCAGVDP